MRPQALPLLALTLLLAGAASAHDTWFELQPQGRPPALLLGTGNRFPLMETRIEPEHLQRHGCARHADLAPRGAAAARPLVPFGGPAGRSPQALALRLPSAVSEASSCWATLVPFDIEIGPDKVAVYLQEIGASASLRAAWAAEQAAGRPWRERYVKHARVEIGGSSATPVGMRLEALLLGGGAPKVGENLRFQVLFEGKPLVDQPVEWINERSPVGIWRRTDAQGQASLAPPLPGRWLLRSTLLRPPAQAGERWVSDFVTLAFDVAPR